MIGQQILCLRGPGAGRGRGIDDDGNTGDGQLARDGGTQSDDLVGAASDVVGRQCAGLIGVNALEARDPKCCCGEISRHWNGH